jgi:peptidoglycan-N-acetylmuramic acid deacetylase
MYKVLNGKRILSAATAAVLLVAAGLWYVVSGGPPSPSITAAAVNNNWGLSFHESGTTPTGNASAEWLGKHDSYFVGDTSKKVLYLTFDCGYESGNTASILDTLKKHDVKAAFFIVGNYINTAADLARRMHEEGHIVGNHTYHHPDMSAIGDLASFKKELTSLSEKYLATTGYEMSQYYRPPQGKFSETNLQFAKELGYKTIFWSLAYVDWKQDDQPTREEAFSKLLTRVHPGAVVLLHNTSLTNAEILDELLTKWEDMGYTFGTLDELTGA